MGTKENNKRRNERDAFSKNMELFNSQPDSKFSEEEDHVLDIL